MPPASAKFDGAIYETTAQVHKRRPSWMPLSERVYRDTGKGHVAIKLSDGDYIVLTIDPSKPIRDAVPRQIRTDWTASGEKLEQLRALVNGIGI